MIIVDSSVWIDYFNGYMSQETDRLDELLYQGEAQILDLIMTEVLQGFSKDKEFRTALQLLKKVPCYNSLTSELAIESAVNFRTLRSKGVTVRKTIDMIIATWCIEHGAKLLHKDKDFRYITNVLPLQTLNDK